MDASKDRFHGKDGYRYDHGRPRLSVLADGCTGSSGTANTTATAAAALDRDSGTTRLSPLWRGGGGGGDRSPSIPEI